MASVIHYTIATEAEKSPDFRRVLWTGEHSQLVIMTIPPGGEIGEEVHEDTDQILTFVSGVGEARVGGSKRKVEAGDLVAVPAGTKHNFLNSRVFADYQAIVDACCDAWNRLRAIPGQIRSITTRTWARTVDI